MTKKSLKLLDMEKINEATQQKRIIND